MLSHSHPGTGYSQRGRSRDVEGSAGIAPGPAGIDQGVAFGAAHIESEIPNLQRRGGLANRFCEADDLFDRLALHVESHQKRCDLSVRRAP